MGYTPWISEKKVQEVQSLVSERRVPWLPEIVYKLRAMPTVRKA
jgi:hypothetical protein